MRVTKGLSSLTEPDVLFDGNLVGAFLSSFSVESEVALIDVETFEPTYLDLNPGIADGSHPTGFLPTPAGLFFTAANASGYIQVWQTDGVVTENNLPPAPGVVRAYSDPTLESRIGIAPNTSELTQFDSLDGPQWLTWFGDSLWFSEGKTLWRYSPTTTTLEAVRSFASAPNSFGPRWLTALGEDLYFTADDGDGEELWKTDGTTDGTILVADIVPGSLGSSPGSLSVLNSQLVFAATTPDTGTELWAFDPGLGTPALIKDALPGTNRRFLVPRDLTPFDGKLFFRVNDGIHGTELWATDGTPQGTALFADIHPGANSSGPRNFFEFNGWLYFVANDGTHGYEIWKTDGSAESLQLVRDIWPGHEGIVDLSAAVVVGDEFYFTASDGEHGVELWRSDGTTEGTSLAAEVIEGLTSSNITAFAGGDDRVVFWTEQIDRNRPESALWEFDGTELQQLGTRGSIGISVTSINLIGDDIFLLSARGPAVYLYMGDRRRAEVVEGTSSRSTLLLDFGDSESIVADRNGVHVIAPDGEVTQVHPFEVDELFVNGDRAWFWRNGIGGSAVLYSLEEGERIPTTILRADEFTAVHGDEDRLLVDVLNFDDSRDLWIADYSPLRTHSVGSLDRRTVEAASINGQVLYVAPAEIGESLYVADQSPANASTGNHQVRAADIDTLIAAALANETATRPIYRDELDVDSNGAVDAGDVDYLFERVLSTERADLDLNGRVDVRDFLTLSRNFGKSDAVWSEGDLNGDGVVDLKDFLLLSSNFGKG